MHDKKKFSIFMRFFGEISMSVFFEISIIIYAVIDVDMVHLFSHSPDPVVSHGHASFSLCRQRQPAGTDNM